MKKSFAAKVIALLSLSVLFTTMILIGVNYFVVQDSVISQMKSDSAVLIGAVKREIESYDIDSLNEIQKIFIATKENSNDGIVYISLSDIDGNLQVTDTEIYGVDAVSGASESEETTSTNPDALDNQGVMDIVINESVYVDGQDVFNISVALVDDSGFLNIGLSKDNMKREILQAIITSVVAGVIILVLSIVSTLFFINYLMKNLKNTMSGLDRLSSGDLNTAFQVNTKDEFGRLDTALNAFTQMLRNTIGKNIAYIENFASISQVLKETGGKLTDVSDDVGGRAEEIGNILNQQSSSVESLRTTVEDFNKQLQDMLKLSSFVRERNDSIRDASDKGNNRLTKLNSSMDDVMASFEEGSHRLERLTVNVEKISDITEVINGVASQTNLLALNAAIEAARAGESGRGFAVVADEIRKLATQVMESSDSITESVVNTVTLLEEVNRGNIIISESIDRQKEVIDQTVESFEQIREEVVEAAESLKEFSTTMNQTVSSSQEIVTELYDLAEVSEKARDSKEKIHESIHMQQDALQSFVSVQRDIDDVSKQLKEGISDFRL